ncbi:MAG: GreA/GreB family elongation factor [Bacteroidia bacterium]|nr:GreA/GreB family elongation factor [Bacteroidia bacterium]
MEPIISENDFNAINEVLIKQKQKEGNFFRGLLKKFKLVKEKEVSDKTVRLNSVVEVWHSLLKKIIKIRIVLPTKENIKQKYVSVFSPISMALIGYKENDTVEINMPGLKKHFKIIKVTNN